jgi:hypothetical protein
MKTTLIVIALVLLSCPAFATAIPTTSESDFLAAIKSSYLFEDFNEYTYGSYKLPSLSLEENGYIAVLSSGHKLYSGNGFMSTNCANDPLIIDFSESAIPVTAIGGHFWPTGASGNNLIGYTKLVLSDGTVYEIQSADYDDFVGFVSHDGTAFEKIEISVLGGQVSPYTWPSVDNLYVGTAHAPEPSTLLLISTGIAGLGVLSFRKKQ